MLIGTVPCKQMFESAGNTGGEQKIPGVVCGTGWTGRVLGMDRFHVQAERPPSSHDCVSGWILSTCSYCPRFQISHPCLHLSLIAKAALLSSSTLDPLGIISWPEISSPLSHWTLHKTSHQSEYGVGKMESMLCGTLFCVPNCDLW